MSRSFERIPSPRPLKNSTTLPIAPLTTPNTLFHALETVSTIPSQTPRQNPSDSVVLPDNQFHAALKPSTTADLTVFQAVVTGSPIAPQMLPQSCPSFIFMNSIGNMINATPSSISALTRSQAALIGSPKVLQKAFQIARTNAMAPWTIPFTNSTAVLNPSRQAA